MRATDDDDGTTPILTFVTVVAILTAHCCYVARAYFDCRGLQAEICFVDDERPYRDPIVKQTTPEKRADSSAKLLHPVVVPERTTQHKHAQEQWMKAFAWWKPIQFP